jgi:hypothetical protein
VHLARVEEADRVALRDHRDVVVGNLGPKETAAWEAQLGA